MGEFEFPSHKCGLYLTHNEHRDYYETVADWLLKKEREPSFLSSESRQRCIDSGEIWELQWYPETPLAFFVVAAPTFAELFNVVAMVLRETKV